MCSARIAWKSDKANDECRERIRTIIERILTGKARMNVYKDIIAETERVKERNRARVERGAGDVPVEPGNRADEQVAVRHADSSGDIRENPARRGQNEKHPRWQKRISGSGVNNNLTSDVSQRPRRENLEE